MTKKKSKKIVISTPTESELLLGWVYLAVELLVLPILIGLLGEQFGGFSDSTANLIYYTTNAVCCALIFRHLWRESLVRSGAHLGRLLSVVLLGFLLLLGANQLVSSLYALLIPEFLNVNNEAVSAMVRQSPALMTLGIVILAPVAEESLFRGLMFLGLVKKNRAGAYALSVLAFCAIHVLSYIGKADPLTLALCFVQYIPAGLTLCYACEATGSLFAPLLIHCAINACSVIFLP